MKDPNGKSPSATTAEPAAPRLDVEVPAARPKRRSYSLKFKFQVLEATDQLQGGEIGAYLRREGLYWSHLSAWRRQRDDGTLKGLASRKPGRRAKQDPQARRIAQLERENARLQEQLRQVEIILDVQKKVLTLCTRTGTSEGQPRL